jgi:hypothetical protein
MLRASASIRCRHCRPTTLVTALSHLTPFEATSLVPTFKIDEKAFALVMQACLAP